MILMMIGKKNDAFLCYGFLLLIPTLSWMGGYIASGEEKNAILPTDFYWNLMKGSKGNWENYEAIYYHLWPGGPINKSTQAIERGKKRTFKNLNESFWRFF